MTDRNIRILQDIFLRNKTKTALKKKSKLPQRLIDDFYSNQEYTQVFNKPFNLNKAYKVNTFIGRYFADEMTLRVKDKRFYILAAVEIFTKYAWVEISDRPHTKSSVNNLFKQFEKSKLPINFIKTDNAGIFNELQNKATHYVSVANDKMHNPHIERFFLSLRSRVNQDVGEIRPVRFRTWGKRDIERIVREYNTEDIHSSTNMIPINVIRDKNHERAILRKVYFARNELNREREPEISPGDVVRISMKYIYDNVFDKKSTKQKWSYTLFRILEKRPTHGYRVELLNNRIHVSDPVDKIKKILKYDIMEKYLQKINYDSFLKYNIIDESKYQALAPPARARTRRSKPPKRDGSFSEK